MSDKREVFILFIFSTEACEAHLASSEANSTFITKIFLACPYMGDMEGVGVYLKISLEIPLHFGILSCI